MADDTTLIVHLRDRMATFVSEREWDQFHSPKNLAMALAVEAAEVMEHFLWIDNEGSRNAVADPVKRREVADEIADVTCLVLALVNSIGLDLSDIVARKMAKNIVKYPVATCKGHYRPRGE